MKNITPKTLKGFRDFLPKEERKRQYAIDILKKTFESYGFEPLETPALEYEEILLGKYGEEGDKLMYRFVDNGERKVALRYDQTVPLARVVAQYGNEELPIPFKRYQIQPVWRAENTQKGRFREFMQCDADIVGIDTPLSDTETIALAAKAVEKLGFKNYKILINDRNIFSDLIKKELFSEKSVQTIIRSIDKLKKNGKEAVLDEMINKGIPVEQATYALQTIGESKPTSRIEKILSLLNKFDIDPEKIEFSPTLARGLDYYNGLIFEIEIEGYSAGSVCGGGRYDNLIGIFTNKQVPAAGFAFGFDRLLEAMEELKLFPGDIDESSAKVLVTIFNQELLNKSLEVSSRLRSNNINTEIYLNENSQIDKQLKYANQKGIPFVIIIGPDEAEKNAVTIRNMKTREQDTLTQEELIDKLKISNS